MPGRQLSPRSVPAIEHFLRNHWAGLLARVRYHYWRYSFANRPTNFSVYGKILVRHPEHVFLGEDVELSEGLYINARDTVTIGDHVRLSAYVRILTGGLPVDVPPDARGHHLCAPVVIGDWAWIATGATIIAGVTIGEGVVVGAGSVVTHDLPAYTLCAGVPAKVIRSLPMRVL